MLLWVFRLGEKGFGINALWVRGYGGPGFFIVFVPPSGVANFSSPVFQGRRVVCYVEPQRSTIQRANYTPITFR
jgi:hypothetical protein